MNTLSRKQREIREREELFLDIAESLLAEHGHQALSMDRIAEIAEYSKGTVYQHFKCKEEVLINICWRGMRELAELFERAAGFDGNSRERMLAVLTAHVIHAKLHPLHFSMISTVKAGGVKEKLSDSSLAEHRALENRIHGAVASLVFKAIEQGDLTMPDCISPTELVYGLWSLSFGGLTLQTYDIPLQELGVEDPNRALAVLSLYALDGVGWRPLSTNHDYRASAERIQCELFTEEFSELARLGMACPITASLED